MRYGRQRAAVAATSVLLMAGLVWAAQGRTLKVTVNYTGSGEVSAANSVFVAVWPSPDFAGDPTAILAQEVVRENGATVSFENLSATTVYLSAVYDEQGGWDAASMLPSGTPAGAYADANGAPSAIEVGDGQTVEIEFSFDDAFRLP